MKAGQLQEPQMSITREELETLMQEVEQEDPIDFADLPFSEQDLRSLVASHLVEIADAMNSFSEEDRRLTLMAVAAKLVLENLVLHIQLLRRHGLPLSDSADALLSRLRRGAGNGGRDGGPNGGA
jgi:arsenate reductase-like glutaredoxin family protein